MEAGGAEIMVTAPACGSGAGCLLPAAGVLTVGVGAVGATHGTLVGANTLGNIFSKNNSEQAQPYENTPENQERMRQVKSPVGNDGKPVELHHPGQKPNNDPGNLRGVCRKCNRRKSDHD
jgi:hypothetical protein